MAQKAAEGEKKKTVKVTKKQIAEFKQKKMQKKVKRILDI
jgi:hypothetical protein